MSKLQTVNDYLRELAELDHLIALEGQFSEQFGTDASAEMTLRSLQNRRDHVVREMEELGDEGMPQQEIAVVFDGRPVVDHAVDANFLGTMLRDLQRVVASLLASEAGSKARTGKHQANVKQRSGLRFAGSFEGSFGMRLETPDGELPLDDVGSVAHSIDSLVELIQAGDNQESLLESISPLNGRARASYMSLLEHLSESGASMRVQWRSVGGERKASLSPRAAGRVLSRLRRVEVKETLDSYRGWLDGGIKSRALFAFITQEGERMEGQVTQGVIDHLHEFHIEQPCVALISTRVVTDHATGDIRVHHRLEELRPMDGDLS